MVMSKDLKKIQIEAVPGMLAGIIENYFNPLAIFLGVSGHQLSYITSYPRLLYSFFQLFVHKVVKFFGSRKKALIFLTYFQAFIIFFLFLGTYALKLLFPNISPLVFLIITYSVFYIVASFRGIIWSVWVHNYIPENERGKFFGFRTKLVNTIFLFVSLGIGIIFTYVKDMTIFGFDGELICFTGLFLLSIISLIISAILFSQVSDLEYIDEKVEESISWKTITNPAATFSKEFITLVLYATLLHVAVFIIAPYTAEYILKIQGYTYFQLIFISVLAATVKILFSPVVGKFVDEFGPAKIFKIGMFFLGTGIIGWTFFRDYKMILFFEIFGNIGWAIWDSTFSILVYEYTTSKNRTIAFTWLNISIGLGCFFGSLISGWLYLLYSSFGDKVLTYNLIFGTSVLMRFILFFVFSRKIKDIKAYKQGKYTEILMNMFRSVPENNFVIQQLAIPFKRIRPKNIIPAISINKYLFNPFLTLFSLFGKKEKSSQELVKDVRELINEVEAEMKIKEALNDIDIISTEKENKVKIDLELPQIDLDNQNNEEIDNKKK